MVSNNQTSQVGETFRQATCISTGVISLFLAIFTSAGNGFLLYVLHKDPLKVLRRPVTVFIGALAVVDFLTGAFSDFAFAAHEFDCAMGANNYPGAIGNFSGIAYFFTVNSALLLVAALSVERLIAVAFPHYYYRNYVTKRKIFIVVAVIYTHSFVFAMLQLAKIPNQIYHNLDLNIHISFPVATVSITYGAIYVIFRKRRLRIDTHKSGENATQRNASVVVESSDVRRQIRNLKIEQQLVSTAFIILLCMIVALIPYLVFVYVEIECPSCIDTEWFFAGRRLCVPFLFSNSAVNPLIYAHRLQHYKNSFRAILIDSQSRVISLTSHIYMKQKSVVPTQSIRETPSP
ncbi:melanocyte-stimulating hormone receptor-like [Actinia tenebrosa]|uniref:Melanocyte-stimulating hormone receptor-like n=1 Tax=Actinia tenebrosa TaxID=6105 RepID=A0A6P8HAH2_ACTTE|nr:melanocyte-stimulating hormone receptor-like [Actinia tenebrosa]